MEQLENFFKNSHFSLTFSSGTDKKNNNNTSLRLTHCDKISTSLFPRLKILKKFKKYYLGIATFIPRFNPISSKFPRSIQNCSCDPNKRRKILRKEETILDVATFKLRAINRKSVKARDKESIIIIKLSQFQCQSMTVKDACNIGEETR